VGRNGCGKTTFIDILMGKTPADKGRFVKGQTVEFGYFSQDGIEPPGDQRIIDIVKDIAEMIPLGDGHEMAASQFLNHFGFNYQTQYNYYHNLSGGERRKLSLLMTLMRNPNFLLLDEPTNDLDIFTLTLLEDFLNNFNGCVMFVSHDRYFIDKMADHIFVFEDKGKIKDYYGSYTAYHEEKVRKEAALRRKQIAEKPKQETAREKDEPKKLSYKQKIEFEQLEKDIAALEEEKAMLLAKMSDPATDGRELQQVSLRYTTIEQLIEDKTTRWLELAEING
jgi:ATP-binding cassette subfamily F protein uup